MAGNVVNITITAENESQAGFDEAAASADEMADKTTEALDKAAESYEVAGKAAGDLGEETRAAMDEYTEALGKAAEAAERLADVSKETGGSQSAYATALNEASAAADRATEAQSRLEEAEGRQSAAAKGAAGGDDSQVTGLDEQAAAANRAAEAQERLEGAEGDQATGAKVAAAGTDEAAASSDTAGDSAIALGGKVKLAALAMVAGAAVSVKMAADWQESLTQLVTGAGEPVKAMAAIKQGILSMSVGTDTSVKDLTSGLYMISSAGYKGASGLNILKAAAEGAKTGDASLASVSNVLTSAMKAYHEPASAANSITNELVATVASGKMHMQDLATAMSSVLPVAASAHISFSQVGGAIATMTAQGMTARRASTNLANMIRAFISPSAAAATEMHTLGLNANKVAQDVGKEGLTGTLSTLTEAILKNTKGGETLASGFAGMSPKVKSYAEAILSGKMTTGDLTTATEGLSEKQAALLTSFATTAGGVTGLKTTYDGAMKTMAGGATGLNVALLLGGKNMSTFKTNVKSVSDAAKAGGANVKGWSDVQGDFNFKLGQAGKSLEAMGYSIGDALLPAATKIIGVLADFGSWLTKNKVAATILAGVIVSVLGAVLGGKLVSSLGDAKDGLTSLFSALKNAPSTISSMASSVSSAASTIGSGIASAASSVASFVAGVATKLAEAAVATGAWIAEHAVATAEFIAQNVAQAASAMAAFVAENLATVGIIAGIALLVAAIVFLATHWKEVWSDIKKVASEAWQFIDGNLIQPIEHGIADMVSWVEDHWKLLAEIFVSVLTGPIGALVVLITTHWNDVKNITTDLISDVKKIFTAGWDDVKDIFKDVWDWLGNFVATEVSGIKNILHWFSTLPGLFKGWWKDVEKAFSAAWDWIKNYISESTNSVKTILGWFGKLGSLFKGWWDDIANAILEVQNGKVLPFIRSLPGKILDLLKALPGDLLQVGKDIIEGLIHGIESAAGGLLSIVKGIAGDISGAFKDVLGIFSPSTVFAQHGKDIVSGLVQGIDQSSGSATAAMRRLAQQLTVPGGGGVAGGAMSLAGAGGTQKIELEFSGGGSDELVSWLKKQVRVKAGGNVQQAFGFGNR